MMDIPCEVQSHAHGDNQLDLRSSTIQDSTLKKKKKSQSVAYHLTLEGASWDEWGATRAHALLNEADFLTKMLSWEKQKGFVRIIFHHVFRYC